jgi:hypothetical protein
MGAPQGDTNGREGRNPSPPSPLQPSGRHCCIGITRFSEALRSRHVQPRCAGLHVVIQDVSPTHPPPRQDAVERTEPEEPKQEASVAKDWRFTCYGFSEWSSSGTAGATLPRCRLGFRPPREFSQPGADREHKAPPALSSQSYKPTLEPMENQAGPSLADTLQATRPEPTVGRERLQQRLDKLRERWLKAGQSLYLATGKTATKICDRDWSRDVDRLHASMSRTATRAATAATGAAEAAQRRIRDLGNPD